MLQGNNTADLFQLDGTGSFTGVTYLLPGGMFPYSVHAHYVGDGNFGGSDSADVLVTIQPEPTTLTVSVLTPNTSGTLVPFTSVPYGTPIYFQGRLGTSGYGKPTSQVVFYDNGSPVTGIFPDTHGNAVASNLQLSAGTHSVTATFSGDNNFLPSSTSTAATFTIGQVASTTKLSSQQTGQQFFLSATVTGVNNGAAPTGTVTFASGSSALGTGFLMNGTSSNGAGQATALFDATSLASGQYTVTASYPGDSDYSASSSAPMSMNLVPDFGVANRGIATQIVAAGQTASYMSDIGVTMFFGFSGVVNLSCSSSAPATSCSVSPASISGANGVASVTVSTTARGMGMPEPRDPPMLFPVVLSIMTIVCICLILLLLSSRAPSRRFARPLALALLLGATVISVASCGGGSSGGSPPPQSGTPAGTYAVTVTATSGTTTHTTTLTLIVQ